MSDQKRQEDMKELAAKFCRESGENLLWEHCNFELSWVTISNHLSDRGEIMVALSIFKEDLDFKYIIITDHNVYYNYHEKEDEIPFLCLCPLYTFDSPLTIESSKILTYKYIYSTLFKESTMEDLIRTIPGSYKNGTWRQLNGFFGLYVNHENETVSVYPTPELQ
jgi:hypothetical protein